MDIQMPNMNGIEATRSIRNTDNLNTETPIIALSANIQPNQQEEYLNVGMHACLAKPIKPQDLRQAVSEFYFKFCNTV